MLDKTGQWHHTVIQWQDHWKVHRFFSRIYHELVLRAHSSLQYNTWYPIKGSRARPQSIACQVRSEFGNLKVARPLVSQALALSQLARSDGRRCNMALKREWSPSHRNVLAWGLVPTASTGMRETLAHYGRTQSLACGRKWTDWLILFSGCHSQRREICGVGYRTRLLVLETCW